MACTTYVYGEGGNCSTGLGLGNLGETSFPGYWKPVIVQVCGRNWTSLQDLEGNLHPNWSYWAYYTPTVSFRYEGCETLFSYDCINGACQPSHQYNTPGLYQSLSECEEACGTGCSGTCVSNKDWAIIQQLSSQLKKKNCT